MPSVSQLRCKQSTLVKNTYNWKILISNLTGQRLFCCPAIGWKMRKFSIVSILDLELVLHLFSSNLLLRTLHEYAHIWKFWNCCHSKAELLQLNRIQFPSLGIFLVKKLEIEKTKTTFIISVLKVVYRVSQRKHLYFILLWRVEICKLAVVWRWFGNPE